MVGYPIQFLGLSHIGALSGVFWTMATAVTAEVLGLQDLASGLSILWLLGTVIPTLGTRPTFVPSFTVVAETIALRLKDGAIAAGKSGADIYRPTIVFTGTTILISGILLIVKPVGR